MIVVGVLGGVVLLGTLASLVPEKPRNVAPSQSSAPTISPSPESPEKIALRQVNIDKVKWYKGGFGSIMIATFVINNPAEYRVQDLTVTCTHFAPRAPRSIAIQEPSMR